MKKLGSKKPQKPIPKPKASIDTHVCSTTTTAVVVVTLF